MQQEVAVTAGADLECTAAAAFKSEAVSVRGKLHGSPVETAGDQLRQKRGGTVICILSAAFSRSSSSRF